jgi:hypothetical protein
MKSRFGNVLTLLPKSPLLSLEAITPHLIHYSQVILDWSAMLWCLFGDMTLANGPMCFVNYWYQPIPVAPGVGESAEVHAQQVQRLMAGRKDEDSQTGLDVMVNLLCFDGQAIPRTPLQVSIHEEYLSLLFPKVYGAMLGAGLDAMLPSRSRPMPSVTSTLARIDTVSDAERDERLEAIAMFMAACMVTNQHKEVGVIWNTDRRCYLFIGMIYEHVKALIAFRSLDYIIDHYARNEFQVSLGTDRIATFASAKIRTVMGTPHIWNHLLFGKCSRGHHQRPTKPGIWDPTRCPDCLDRTMMYHLPSVSQVLIE